MNSIHRAFIAADIPLAYSQGFHPHPKIGFGPPLPFGVIGLSELFDVVTMRDVSLEHLLLINKWLPRDLLVRNCLQLIKKEEALNAIIMAAEYVFSPNFTIDFDTLTTIAQQALLKKEILISIKENECGPLTQKNIRSFISSLKTVDKGGTPALCAVLSLSPQALCRPSEFISGLFPDRKFTDFITYRTECLKKEGNTLIALWKDSI
jgi:radical SAM-linked protein